MDDEVLERNYIKQIDNTVKTSQNALVLCMREMSFDSVKDQEVLSKGNYISGQKRGRSKRRWTLLRKHHRLCETALGNRGRGGGTSKPEERKLNWEDLLLIVQRTAPTVAAEGIQI